MQEQWARHIGKPKRIAMATSKDGIHWTKYANNPLLHQVVPMEKTGDAVPPKAFVSYSWDSEAHKAWTKALAARLRRDGVDVTLDQWEAVPGDQLPMFMETAIRENSYVLIICTPKYKTRSDNRTGGVGYEGDIMTGEVLTEGNDRKFIPILRSGSWTDSMPSWLKGKYSIDLSGDPYAAEQYDDLLATLHNARERAPKIGPRPTLHKSIRNEAKTFLPSTESLESDFEPIAIKGILVDEAGRPGNDGSRGSALYSIPFKLNRAPPHEWGELFKRTWDRPPRYTTRHRPGIARVQADRIVLVGTTIEEVKDVHRDTLKLVIDSVNERISEIVRKRRVEADAKATRDQEHRENLKRIADDISFD